MGQDRSRRIVLTGASGTLGRVLAPALAARYPNLLLTDIAAFPDPLPGSARFVQADLADAATLGTLCADARAIVHFGGVNGERSFDSIVSGNILGVHTIFEAARQAKARVIFASSNHVIGFYPRDQKLDIETPARPDSLYGVSKVFGEAVGRLYFDKHGVESVHLRIGSCLPKPVDERSLSTWLSYSDLIDFVVAAIEAAQTDFAIVWGISANTRAWWTGDDAARLGMVARDNAETYADRLTSSKEAPVAARFQGGPLCIIDYSRDV